MLRLRSLALLVMRGIVACGMVACATAVSGTLPPEETETETIETSPSEGTAPPSPGVSTGGVGIAPEGPGGAGLASNHFGPEEETEEPQTAACDYGSAPSCDFGREQGCCQHLACERANGHDVFNTYPVESCQNLVACVKAHPGCSNADDPLCFGNEAPSAPCLQEGYQASHQDPEGPFVWTTALLRCICGY